MPSDDDQQWPKQVKAKLLLTAVVLLALDGLNHLFT
jgi:hypothetical protein